jgi:hypothetical protein
MTIAEQLKKEAREEYRDKLTKIYAREIFAEGLNISMITKLAPEVIKNLN